EKVRQIKREADTLGEVVNTERLRSRVLFEGGDIGGAIALLDEGGFERAIARNQIKQRARGLVNGAAFAHCYLKRLPSGEGGRGRLGRADLRLHYFAADE